MFKYGAFNPVRNKDAFKESFKVGKTFMLHSTTFCTICSWLFHRLMKLWGH